MLLYKDPCNRYVAVHPALRFSAGAGFQICHQGQQVPRPVCELFIRRWGGQILEPDDEIVLEG